MHVCYSPYNTRALPWQKSVNLCYNAWNELVGSMFTGSTNAAGKLAMGKQNLSSHKKYS